MTTTTIRHSHSLSYAHSNSTSPFNETHAIVRGVCTYCGAKIHQMIEYGTTLYDNRGNAFLADDDVIDAYAINSIVTIVESDVAEVTICQNPDSIGRFTGNTWRPNLLNPNMLGYLISVYTCQCEHIDCPHEYLETPADNTWHGMFVGPVCGECATTHMAGYVRPAAQL